MTFSDVNLMNFRHKIFRQNPFSTMKSGRDTVATEELCPKKLITKADKVDFTETIFRITFLNPHNIRENNVDRKVIIPV